MATPRVNAMIADGGEPGQYVPKASSKVTPQEREKRLRDAAANAQAALDKYVESTTKKTPEPKDEPEAVEYFYASDGTRFTDQNAMARYEQALRTAEAAEIAAKSNESLLKGQQALAAEKKQREDRAARASLQSWLGTFFDPTADAKMINDLMAFIDQQITEDVPAEAITLNIRGQKFYQERFAGNEALRKKGLPELTPEQYLLFERQYSEVLRQSGLERLATRQNFASLIGGEVSNVELQDRVTNVYSRIVNADAALRSELQTLKSSTNITDADLAESLLMGKEGASILKRKISMAEIGAEFTPRGLKSALGAEELVNLGVTREQARAGAEMARIGTERLGVLSDVYGVSKTGLQAELETEAFKGLESQRRRKLTEMEKSAFAGSAGTGTPSLGRTSAGAI